MLKWGCMAVCAALLGGCASYDRAAMSSFRPADSGAGVYIFETQTGISYPADSENAEATRKEWIGQYMVDNGFCSQGYEIEQRDKIKVSNHAEGYNLIYRLKCL